MTLQTKLPGSQIQTGSIPVTAITNFAGQLSASLPPDVVSSSAQVTAFLPPNTVSSSGQVTTFLPADTVSSSGQVKIFLPDGTVSSSAQYPGWVTSSAQYPGWVTASSQVDITQTTNYTTFSSSISTADTTQTSRLGALENVTGSYATTGSNIFVGTQSFSDTTNTTSYLDGAIHVAGGMSIRQDLRVSGSMTINGLLTAVSMSTQYVTSSQYNVGVSKITLNDDDVVRFAGISIYDSGSASPTSASIYWDSLQHRFIYENLSGSAYNSSIIIAGPKHTGSLGDEPTLTTGYIPVATGGDHIDNSVIFQSGSNIGIGITTPNYKLNIKGDNNTTPLYVEVGSNARYQFSGNSTSGYTTTFNMDDTGLSIGHNSSLRDFRLQTDSTTRIIITGAGNVGIGTTNPQTKLDVRGSIASSYSAATYATFDSSTDGNLYITANAGAANVSVNTIFRSSTAGGAVTERMRIDSSGNLGLGTTPSAWATGWKVIDIGANGSLAYTTAGDNDLTLAINAYYDTTDARWEYKSVTDKAARYSITAAGVHAWYYTNTNGTANGPITFTEAMRINSSGNVGIGTTNPTAKLEVSGSSGLPVFISSPQNASLTIKRQTTSNKWTFTHDSNGGNVGIGANGLGIISDDANGDFGIRTTSTGNVQFYIATSGNIGIGTTNPTATLQVVGPNTTGTFIAAQNDGAGGFLGVRVNAGSFPYNHFSFSNGYVGIGTTSPSTTLVVVGGVAAISTSTVSYTIAVQDPTSAAINVGGSILFQGYKTGTASIGNYAYITGKKENGTAGNEAGYLALGTFDSGGNRAEYFRITSAGNVGIGTTNPFALLHVKGTDSLTANTRYFKGWIGGAGSWGANSYEELGVGFSGIRSIYISGDNWDLAFSTGTSTTFNAGTQAERMRIKANGNVGIGTTNPDDKFQVNGGNLRVSANTTSGTFLDIVPSGTQADGIALSTSFYGGGSYGPLRIATGGSETMRITAGNRVGIGETNPGVKLHVEGIEYNRGNIVRPTVFAGDSSSTGGVQGTYVLGNGKFFNTGGGAKYVHILLPARYNQDASRMFCVEIKGYDFDRPGIINVMVGGYVTPPNNGGPMSRVATWDATSYYSPTAYYSTNYAVGVVRIYFPSIYYVSFVVNSIASGNGDTIAPDEMTMILSTSATI